MKDIFATLVLGMLIFGFGGINILDSVFPVEPIYRGDTAEIKVTAYNEPGDMSSIHGQHLKNMQIGAYWLDLGIIDVTSEFDLRDGEVATFSLFANIPRTAPKGWQPVYVWVDGDNGVSDAEYIFTYIE